VVQVRRLSFASPKHSAREWAAAAFLLVGISDRMRRRSIRRHSMRRRHSIGLGSRDDRDCHPGSIEAGFLPEPAKVADREPGPLQSRSD
jgi:hypothetical protein